MLANCEFRLLVLLNSLGRLVVQLSLHIKDVCNCVGVLVLLIPEELFMDQLPLNQVQGGVFDILELIDVQLIEVVLKVPNLSISVFEEHLGVFKRDLKVAIAHLLHDHVEDLVEVLVHVFELRDVLGLVVDPLRLHFEVLLQVDKFVCHDLELR